MGHCPALQAGRSVAAAETAIAEQGIDASLEEIARRDGVGPATLHQHFPSRQDSWRRPATP
ncbi:helix-turn-helix domain-containing protein [Streptomyces chattanoogensis]|uniref:helix-turn-helix domain-containing protein n=1 Tax=Streptomyces chattanoogensis TaxID=66876 RepID=UPI0006966EB5